MSTAQDAREAVRQTLQSGLLESWTCYAQPPDTVTAPAAVVSPGEPYRETTAYRTEDLSLRVVLLLQGGPVGSLDRLDEAIEQVLVALNRSQFVSVRQVGSVGLVQEVGGAPYLSATIDLTVPIERTRT